MHEYLHKNLENITKTRKNFTRNMRPLAIVSPQPPAGGYGGFFLRLCDLLGVGNKAV